MINEQAKHASVARLRKAIELEKLATTHAASCLGLNPCYLSMALNEKSWIKMPAYAWDRLICWCNSGLTLKSFKIPDGVQVYQAKDKANIEWHKVETKFDVPAEVRKAKESINQAENYSADFATVKKPDPIKYELKSETKEFNPVKNGEYIDPIDLLKDIASRLPANVKIVITINNE